MAAKPVLYSYYLSSCSWRVRIGLALKGIEYEYKPVHLNEDGGKQHTEEYKAVNPIQQVPSLVIDGHTFSQSVAILEYLEETRPSPALLPKDPVKRAQARMLTEIISSSTQPMQNSSVLRHPFIGNERKLEWSRYWVERGLKALEKQLEKTSGVYCVGDELTMADLLLPPQVYNASYRFDVDMTQFPNINRINAKLEELDAFKAAHPNKQPDCPDDLK